MKISLKIIFSALILFLFSISFKTALGADFLVSWKAKSFTPSWFEGKAFPSFNSQMEVKFDLIDQGKIIDLSKNKIRWYVNGKLIRNESDGLGIKSVSFKNNLIYGGNDLEVRISIPDYKQSADKIIKIPVKFAESSIEAPYFEGKNGKTMFYAWPFFFNVFNMDQLGFEWKVNNTKAENSKNSFQFDSSIYSEERNLIIDAGINNPKEVLERTSKSLKLR